MKCSELEQYFSEIVSRLLYRYLLCTFWLDEGQFHGNLWFLYKCKNPNATCIQYGNLWNSSAIAQREHTVSQNVCCRMPKAFCDKFDLSIGVLGNKKITNIPLWSWRGKETFNIRPQVNNKNVQRTHMSEPSGKQYRSALHTGIRFTKNDSYSAGSVNQHKMSVEKWKWTSGWSLLWSGL